MKTTVIFIFSLLLLGCNPVKNADRRAQKDQITVLYPDVAFNKEQAKNQLGLGKSTIKGVLYKSTNKLSVLGAKAYGANLKVDLFPVNDYFTAWHNLRKKKENKKTNVYMSEEAFSMRIEATTDQYGRFEFKGLKPGKYFIQAIMPVTQAYTRDVVVGTNSYGTQFYEKERYNLTKYHRNEEFVEIKNDGEIVEVKLN
jgi:hypothetical protein